jgi:hypothetical protein
LAPSGERWLSSRKGLLGYVRSCGLTIKRFDTVVEIHLIDP